MKYMICGVIRGFRYFLKVRQGNRHLVFEWRGLRDHGTLYLKDLTEDMADAAKSEYPYFEIEIIKA